jgi:type I restriction enzyme S subunit
MLETETKVQRYKRYIDSGVEWLGEVPEHWDLTRLGTRFKERKTKVSDKDFPPLSVTKNGTVPQLANAAKSNDGDNRKLVKKGDFAINSRSDRKGSSGIAYQDGSVSLIYIVMEPLNIHPIYCNYLLKSYNFIEEFYRMGHGIVADLWTTRYDEMKAIMVGIPPLPEQTAIAQFLDDKTTKIDAAITIKQQQISLLKERKQILIHKAVTRGLDDSVQLKDSGVEWIGDIPEGWEVKRLKFTSNLVSEKVLSKESQLEYIGMENIKSWTGQFIPSDSETDGLANYFDKGDVLFGKLRPYLAKVYLAKKEGICSSEFLVYRAGNLTYNWYLNLIMLSFEFINLIDSSTYGSKMPRANSEFIGNQVIPIPPLSEQKEISAYIETASQKIETAIGLKQQEIAKLKEYKSSLINGVVTGKVKVC